MSGLRKHYVRGACRPDESCHLRRTRNYTGHLLTSDTQMDFFYLSELRLYVLHALRQINWVWYPRCEVECVPRCEETCDEAEMRCDARC